MKLFTLPLPANSRGFSLIEVIIVVGMLSVIALTGTNTIIEFQRNAVLTAAAQELVSAVRTAQTRSIAGQLEAGEAATDFSADGLPYFGIQTAGNAYQLVRVYTPAVGAPVAPETLENHTIDANIVLSTSPVLSPPVFTFSRVTGLPSAAILLTLTRAGGTAKTITVAANGLISL